MDDGITIDSLKIFTATIISFLLSLIINIGLARSLGPDGKGIFSVAMTLSGLLTSLVDSGFSISLIYFVGQRKYPTKELLGYSVLWGLGAGFFLAIVAWLIKDVVILKVLKSILPIHFVLTLGLVILGVQGNFTSAILRGEYRLRWFSILLILRPAIQCVLVYFAIFTKRLSITSALVYFVISYLITALAGFAVIAKTDGVKFSTGLQPMQRLFSFGIKGQIGNIIQFFNYRFDLFLVNYFLIAYQVGLYSVSVNIAEILWFIPNSFAITLFSKVSSLPVEKSNFLTVHILQTSFLLTLLSGIGLFVLGRPIVLVLFGRQFLGSVKPLLVLLPGILGLTISKILCSDLAGRGKPQYLTYISSISVVLTIGLDFLLIPRIGILGAAMASSVAYIAAGLSSLWWFVKVSKVRLRDILIIRPSDLISIFNSFRPNRIRS
jgi:O-antigen/teichoic acid export membrane protein